MVILAIIPSVPIVGIFSLPELMLLTLFNFVFSAKTTVARERLYENGITVYENLRFYENIYEAG